MKAAEIDEQSPLLGAVSGYCEKSEMPTELHVESFPLRKSGPKSLYKLSTDQTASFTQARIVNKRRLPQCIAHRGYKAENPENTMQAFKAAVEKGRAHAIETDIHLTKDNVVVLSH